MHTESESCEPTLAQALPPQLTLLLCTCLPTVLVFFTSLLPRRSPPSPSFFLRFSVLGIFVSCYYRALCILAHPPLEAAPDLMAMGTLSAVLTTQCFGAWWFLFSPESDAGKVRFIKDGVELERLGTCKRLLRSTELWCCTRAVGWNIEVRCSASSLRHPIEIQCILLRHPLNFR